MSAPLNRDVLAADRLVLIQRTLVADQALQICLKHWKEMPEEIRRIVSSAIEALFRELPSEKPS